MHIDLKKIATIAIIGCCLFDTFASQDSRTTPRSFARGDEHFSYGTYRKELIGVLKYLANNKWSEEDSAEIRIERGGTVKRADKKDFISISDGSLEDHMWNNHCVEGAHTVIYDASGKLFRETRDFTNKFKDFIAKLYGSPYRLNVTKVTAAKGKSFFRQYNIQLLEDEAESFLVKEKGKFVKPNTLVITIWPGKGNFGISNIYFPSEDWGGKSTSDKEVVEVGRELLRGIERARVREDEGKYLR